MSFSKYIKKRSRMGINRSVFFTSQHCQLIAKFVLVIMVQLLITVPFLFADETAIDLSEWTSVNYSNRSSQYGNWQVQDNGTSVLQTVNGDPTYFVSDFDLIDSRFEGNFRVETNSDDDFIGFTFGFQGLGEGLGHYLLTWKQYPQSGGEEGFKLFKIDGYPEGIWQGQPSEYLTILAQHLGPGTGWKNHTTYTFSLSYSNGNIRIVIVQENTDAVVWDTGLIVDPEPLGIGKVGFYNHSQAYVRYSGFTREAMQPPVAVAGGPYVFDAATTEIVLDATGSYDPDGVNQTFDDITGLKWVIGNDETNDNPVRTDPLEVITFEEVYAKGLRIGSDVPVQLTVTDSDGLTGSAVVNITYNSTPPEADANPENRDYIVSPGSIVRLVGSAGDADLDLPYDMGEVLVLEWDFQEARKQEDIGDGFADSLEVDVPYELLSANQSSGFVTIYLNVADASGKIATSETIVTVIDNSEPEIISVLFDGDDFVEGALVTQSGSVKVNAVDPSGISHVEFYLNNTLICRDHNPHYQCHIDVHTLEDGTHTLRIVAYDSLGNTSVSDYDFTVEISLPGLPAILTPKDGFITNQREIGVSGTAEKHAVVFLYINGVQAGGEINADAAGRFAGRVSLGEGLNAITARAQNRAGTGNASLGVTVVRDTAVPDTPARLSAVSGENGRIRLSWNAVNAHDIAGYHLYRHISSFDSVAGATRLTQSPIRDTLFVDLPESDGIYHYRVTAVSRNNNHSGLSNEVHAIADSHAPYAVFVSYSPEGAFDPETGAMGQGRVNVELVVSEPLVATPFLSITPEGGIPLSVILSKVSDTEYAGHFIITGTMPSGTAWAVFSGRDRVGNRGTAINEGRTLQIDACGPEVTRLHVIPASPIRNNQPTMVTAIFGLNEPVSDGEAPDIEWRLSGEGRLPFPVDTLTEIEAMGDDAQTWQATFTLPPDGGLDDPEILSFIYEATDSLGNTSTLISAENAFQVYQGELPPLETPTSFTGKPLPGGKIRLTWNPVSGAAGYQLYRTGPETSHPLEPLGEPMDGSATEYMDLPAIDGIYSYAIASIRYGNDQESRSALSPSIDVRSDSISPPPPEDLTLELVSTGIRATWSVPDHPRPLTHALYRSSMQIISIEDMTPAVSGIADKETTATDANPSSGEHYYAVVAIDQAGNISEPSGSVYLNFGLLPVNSLTVEKAGDDLPVLSWTHTGSIAGCNVYIGQGEHMRRLNDQLVVSGTYTDTGYAGDERTYTVVAVDQNSHESLARSITLPPVTVDMAPESRIRRGIMNALAYTLTSNAANEIREARLSVMLNGITHVSEPFSIPPGRETTTRVIVGGYADLPDMAALTTTLIITDGPNETVRLTRAETVSIGNDMLDLRLYPSEFKRGGTGSVRFTLRNTSDLPIEIITAQKTGKKPTDDISVYLEDRDGNVIAAQQPRISTGGQVVTLPNGNTVARIAPGESFHSPPLELSVPGNAPENLIIRMTIAKIYYHHNQPTEVLMAGMGTSANVKLVDTAWYGEVTSVTPETSTGDAPVIITGRSVNRSTGEPLSSAPLNLVIENNGFERSHRLLTDHNGEFSFDFIPLIGESGIYNVSAIHPDLSERPVHVVFVISTVTLQYSRYQLAIPRNFERTVSLDATVGRGTTVHNLRFEYVAQDQPEQAFSEGVHVTCGAPVDTLYQRQSAGVSFSVWGDNRADETIRIVLRLVSDESPDGWVKIPVNIQFRASAPGPWLTPNHVETGTSAGVAITETVRMENRGTATLEGVSARLANPDGTPVPDWVYLTAGHIGDLEPGQATEIPIVFFPPDTIQDGSYEFRLRVESANAEPLDQNLYVAVTRSGRGSIAFKVMDLFTGSIDEEGNTVQGLAGANIRLQNEAVLSEEYSVTTDHDGDALLADIPAGRYKYRVRGHNHQQETGRVWIKPGITVAEEVFLEYALVTVSWEVRETTIEDKYDIVLTATYETQVPAPVLVIEPASVSLPEMAPGEVFYGEFTLTNHGLVRADDVTLAIPGSDEYFRFEFLAEVPSSIAANERATVPYRVTCLKSFHDDAGDGTGGNARKCYRHRRYCAVVGYKWVCAHQSDGNMEAPIDDEWGDFQATNRYWRKASVSHCWTVPYEVECASGSSGGGGGAYDWGPGGGGGSGGWASSPAPTPMAGSECIPECEDECCYYTCCDPCEVPDKCEIACIQMDSAANLLSGRYSEEITDLGVRVPGGVVAVKRSPDPPPVNWALDRVLQRGNYRLEHERPLRFIEWTGDGRLETIYYMGAKYATSESPSSASWMDIPDSPGRRAARTYALGSQTITRTSHEPYMWRWQDIYGNWKLFDSDGYLQEYGNRSGAIASFIYRNNNPEDGASGVLDRNGRQVIWYDYNAAGRISVASDNAGRRVEYGYESIPGSDFAGRLVSVIDVMRQKTLYEYHGNDLRITYPNGTFKSIHYDKETGLLARVNYNDEGAYTFFYSYNNARRERHTVVTEPSGLVREVWHSPDNGYLKTAINGEIVEEKEFLDNGRVILTTEESGYTTRTEHNEWNQPTRVVHPDGSETATEYDNIIHKPIRKTDERGIVTTFIYDENANLARKTDAAGTTEERITDYSYDASGNLVEIRIPGPPDSITTMGYDQYGNMTSKTNPDGNTWFFTYDEAGNMITRTDPRGNVFSHEYNAAGNMVKMTDPLGYTISYEYDVMGNQVKQIGPGGTETRFTYNASGHMRTRTLVMGDQLLTTTYGYTIDGNLISATDPEGITTTYEYDQRARMIRTTDSSGNQVRMHYDSGASGCGSCAGSVDQPAAISYPTFDQEIEYDTRGRRTAERDIGDWVHETLYQYDGAGNLVATTDKNGRTTRYAYDMHNRIVRVIDPASGMTDYRYDQRDNLVSLTDAQGNTTRFEYNVANRLTAEIRPEGQRTEYEYDAAGNLVRKIDAKNQAVEYIYDSAGRLIEIHYLAHHADGSPVKSVRFTYDASGNLTGYDDSTTSATYHYDAAGRKISETVNYGGFTKNNTYSYLKNNLKKTFTGPDNITYGYLYDNTRLAGIQIPDTGFITINDYTWNRPNAVTLPGGATRRYEYDAMMRPASIIAQDPGGNKILNYHYEYDNMSNITDIATEHGEYRYNYDPLDRLIDVDNPTLTPEVFSYDHVGNRLTSHDTSGAWHYNRNNEFLGYNHTSYEYDANGNMIQKIEGDTVTSYVYNTEDRLTEVWNGDPGTGTLIASYYYDPFGRRLWKAVSGTKTCFMYADEGLIAEMDATGTITKSYGWHPDGTWGTDPLFMTEGRNPNGTPRYYFYHNDHLGTPRKLTSTSGAVVWSATYSSFGEAHVAPGLSVTNNLRFPGQYYDKESGLHYNWFRHYEPGTGRYLRTDPIGFKGGINIYTYVIGNPVNLKDYNGKVWGFGFSFKILMGGLSFERLFDRCCDGKTIWKRTIAKNCWSYGPSLKVKIPMRLPKYFKPTIDTQDNLGHCKENIGEDWTTDESSTGFEAIVYGYDSKEGHQFLPLGAGAYRDWHTHCRYTVLKKKEDGCCRE